MIKQILDSGASLGITNRRTLEKFNIKEELYAEPFNIKYANGKYGLVTSYGYFGEVLGNIAIVDEAPRSLISIYWLLDRGFSVEFKHETVTIYNKDDKLIHMSSVDKNSKLWSIKFEDLINLELNENKIEEYHKKLSKLVNIIDTKNSINILVKNRERKNIKKKRLSNEITNKVHKLHKILNHADSPESMIQALREGAWDGVDDAITPEIIREVYKRVDCISCKLGKSNRLPMKQGYGVQIFNVGEHISVDRCGPISPVDINGYNFFYYKG